MTQLKMDLYVDMTLMILEMGNHLTNEKIKVGMEEMPLFMAQKLDKMVSYI
ncbi:hypothetical protein [Paraclostridium dentum]|uniref:hypothetical protein n=1 Tax=Paraclostridium dentum TaxID=2662455 RepID=UPI003F2BCF30